MNQGTVSREDFGKNNKIGRNKNQLILSEINY